MNHDWMIDISVDGKSDSEQICLSSGDSGTHLNQCDKSDAIIYTENDEIFIERVGESPVEIERYSRKRLIKTDHPTRILTNDTIRVGAAEYHVRGIYRLNQPRRTTSFFNQFAKQVLLTSAAAIMLAVIPACKPAEPSNPVITEPPESTDVVEVNNSEGKVSDSVDVNTAEGKVSDSVDVNNVEGELPAVVEDDNNDVGNEPAKDDVKNEPAPIVDVNTLRGDAEIVPQKVEPPVPAAADATKCENGKTKCSDDKREIHICDNHEWKPYAQCSGSVRCKQRKPDADAVCDFPRIMGKMSDDFKPDCTGDRMKCGSDNVVQGCMMGNWASIEKCLEPFVCKEVSRNKAVCKKAEK